MKSAALTVRYLGHQDYLTIWQKMRDFTDQRVPDTVDECWIVEHPPVFTLGQAGKESHILQRTAIPVVKTDRGGQVTYHGPGQVMLYCLLDIKRKQIGVRDLVTHLEQTVINLLASYSITSSRREGAPGIYVQDAKIAALGLRIRRGCSYHGLALNVDMDLTPFEYINPCGYSDLAVINLNDLLTTKQRVEDVEGDLLDHFIRQFQYEIRQ